MRAPRRRSDRLTTHSKTWRSAWGCTQVLRPNRGAPIGGAQLFPFLRVAPRTESDVLADPRRKGLRIDGLADVGVAARLEGFPVVALHRICGQGDDNDVARGSIRFQASREL